MSDCKYIIMCGGNYKEWETPKHLTVINGERIVDRTIRLLREQGIEDIAISTNNPAFNGIGVPILHHKNTYYARAYNDMDGYWHECFYPMEEPACYIFGDVVFSPEAIKTIVETPTDDIMLFGSKPPFAKEYPKPYIEPFAYKVVNQKHLREACAEVEQLDALGRFGRKPIAWELWSVITLYAPKRINYKAYVGINDYTCDIDGHKDIAKMEKILGDL